MHRLVVGSALGTYSQTGDRIILSMDGVHGSGDFLRGKDKHSGKLMDKRGAVKFVQPLEWFRERNRSRVGDDENENGFEFPFKGKKVAPREGQPFRSTVE